MLLLHEVIIQHLVYLVCSACFDHGIDASMCGQCAFSSTSWADDVMEKVSPLLL